MSVVGRASLVAVGVMTVLGAAAFSTRGHWLWVVQGGGSAEVLEVYAPPVADVDDPEDFDREVERLYRVSPGNGSAARYEVEERLGMSRGTTVGVTTAIAGEIAVNTADLASSRVGEIVVNVEALQSDSALRDKRIRHDFLESGHWPLVRFKPRAISGLDREFRYGVAYRVSITGDLTVKRTTREETFEGTVTAYEDRLSADVSAVVLSSDYDVGPVHIARLAHTSDEVLLGFELEAGRIPLGAPPAPDGEGPRGGFALSEHRPKPAGELEEQAHNAAAAQSSGAPQRDAEGSRPARYAPEGGAAPRDGEPGIPAGEFAAAVQPILEWNCVSCHTSGGPGWSTLALDTAADAAEIAADIAFVADIDFMPPWLPSDLSPAFEHDWSLSDADKAALAAWADAGGGLDVPPGTPLTPRRRAVIPIEQDYEIPPRDGPYTGYSERDGTPVKKDDYRCQVHEVPDAEGDGTWIRGFEFRPGQASVVHHAISYRVPAAAADEIAARIAAEDRKEAAGGLADEPGWTCFGLSGLQAPGVAPVLGWAPGQSPTRYPQGHGLYLEPGDMLVNQIHYHYDHETPADSSSIVLDIAEQWEIAAGIKRVLGTSYVTPAEVPCTPAEKALAEQRAAAIGGYINLCVRENVLDDIAEKYDAFARLIPDLLILQCGGTVDDYDDLRGSVGHSSCDLPAGDTGAIHTVLAHMHEFGSAYRMTLHPDTPEERILLDIDVWDFEWQLYYEPVEDIRIEKGDTVRFECWWDRSLQHMEEPRYIIWNEGTVDEMCFSVITVLSD